jgi:hypothetical protein
MMTDPNPPADDHPQAADEKTGDANPAASPADRPPPAKAEIEEMGGESACQLHQFWDPDE